jgi:DNA-binding Xre family transcriptional regulator
MQMYKKLERNGGGNVSIVAYNAKRIMLERGVKQVHIARLAGIKPATFYNMMAGRQSIKADDIQKICAALSVAPNELFASRPA